MPKFRKKPIVIDAVRVRDTLRAAGHDWKALPDWVADAYEAGNILFACDHIIIKTLEGNHRGEPADMLIRGIKGELYPCKPDIFEQTYDLFDSAE